MTGGTTAAGSIAVRAATPDDVAAITAIYDHAVRHGTASFELEPPDAAEMARRRTALADAGYPYLVAETDGAVAGYAYAGPYRPRPAYRWSVEDSVYVAPALHRRGIGAALLGRLIIEAERRGFRQMIAVIGDSAQTPSIALHRAAGFRLIGTVEHVGHKFGRWLDTVLMQRALGPGASEPPGTLP
ncbi:MAG TPA: GNAT family N-acetyltransferase [Xanthobacteraceae bacterium]|nr:GNAT family N-acetyltransferase [Xanthobacteraceae bacterium]